MPRKRKVEEKSYTQKLKDLEKRVSWLEDEILRLKMEKISEPIKPTPYPYTPTTPIGPYYENPLPKNPNPFFRGPWMVK